MLEDLKEHTFNLAATPVILYLVFIVFSFIKDFQTGLGNLLIAVFGLPLTIINQLLLFYILKLFFSKESSVPVIVLSLVALSSLLTALHRMIYFVKIKNVNAATVTPTVKAKTVKK
jgi:hypothetical protein